MNEILKNFDMSKLKNLDKSQLKNIDFSQFQNINMKQLMKDMKKVQEGKGQPEKVLASLSSLFPPGANPLEGILQVTNEEIKAEENKQKVSPEKGKDKTQNQQRVTKKPVSTRPLLSSDKDTFSLPASNIISKQKPISEKNQKQAFNESAKVASTINSSKRKEKTVKHAYSTPIVQSDHVKEAMKTLKDNIQAAKNSENKKDDIQAALVTMFQTIGLNTYTDYANKITQNKGK